MRLKTDKIYLRLISEKDLELLRSWRNKYAKEFFSAESITKEMQRNWYANHQESGAVDMMWIIYDKSTNSPCGTIALYHISLSNRSAELGRILILEEFRGRGLMEEAVDLVTNLAFTELHLYQVRVFAYLDNLKGLSLYEKAGFEGTTRPIIMLEKKNFNYDPRKPIRVSSYDEMSEDAGYEGQCSNIKGVRT